MKIAICEDEHTYSNSLQEKIKRWQKERKIYDVQIALFESSEDFLYAWDRNLTADLLLLDILFPNEMNGLTLAQHIRETDTNIPIVFITNSEAFLHDGYTVSALRYLNKPIKYSELYPCLDIAYKQYRISCRDLLVVAEQGRRIVLRYSEIIYLEAQTPYTLLYKEKSNPIKIRMKFSAFLSKLPSNIFIPIHRSYVVNVMHICALKRNEILVSSGDILPLSKTYSCSANDSFDQYFQIGEYPE